MTTASHKLLAIACRMANRPEQFVLSDLERISPRSRNNQMDWRNYIGDDLVELWGELDLSARLVAFIAGCKNSRAEV